MLTRNRCLRWLAPAALGALAPLAGTAGSAGASAAAGYSFAPYLDVTDYPTPDLAAIRRTSGVRQATLVFVTARGTTVCAPSWGGYAADPASGPGAFERRAIAAFRRAGGQAVISFGRQARWTTATRPRPIRMAGWPPTLA